MHLALFFIVCLSGQYSLAAENVLISVYFESLCPDSRAFITTQLYPTKQQLGEALEVDLIPFGKATTEQDENGTLSFTCQHGPNECYGNKVEACAISIYPEQALEFVYCAEASSNPSSDDVLSKCATSTGISWEMLTYCIESGLGDELLADLGVRTSEIELSWVPTVIFDNNKDDVNDDALQKFATSDLKALVCELVDQTPDGCK